MAVAKVEKILIISHQSQAEQLLKAVQKAGVVHLLDTDNSAVVKADTELKPQTKRDRQTDELFQKLDRAVAFLKNHRHGKKMGTLLAPRVVVDKDDYNKTIDSDKRDDLLNQALQLQEELDQTISKQQELTNRLENLQPWVKLQDDLASFRGLNSVDVFAGVIPANNRSQLENELLKPENAASFNVTAETKTKIYCVIITLKEKSAEVYKLLRANEFESANFEGLEGSVNENIEKLNQQLSSLKQKKQSLTRQAESLAESLLTFEILYDYYGNKSIAGEAFNSSAITEKTRIFEGWIKKADMKRLKEAVSKFDAASLCTVEPEKDEPVPVEIQNKPWAKPFEVVTRFYGMPRYFEVDPTVVLAPFFAIFFALCLSDAGYGLFMIGVSIYMLKKMQVGKEFMRMILICSVLTIFTGAMTGGWFGNTIMDAAQKYNIGWLESFLQHSQWFNPLKEPMTFMLLSLICGYLQIMTGFIVGFFTAKRNSGLFAAMCDKLNWLILLNSVIIMAFAKAGYLPKAVGKVAIVLIFVSAVWILLLSHREGGLGARFAMGSYNLFSAVFYVGDLLSYLRLMAVGMATGGVAMAVNIIAGLLGETPYVGWLLALVFLIVGHLFNVLLSLLGAFVHSLRLQFVEFFPKFLEGGGMPFEAFKEDYRYVYVKDNKD